jgi:hypothetical protein
MLWQGPEVEYDRVKAALQSLVHAEIERRRIEEEERKQADKDKKANCVKTPVAPAPPPPKAREPAPLGGAAAMPQAAGAGGDGRRQLPQRPASSTPGTRLGLLTFHGINAPPRPASAIGKRA